MLYDKNEQKDILIENFKDLSSFLKKVRRHHKEVPVPQDDVLILDVDKVISYLQEDDLIRATWCYLNLVKDQLKNYISNQNFPETIKKDTKDLYFQFEKFVYKK